MVSKYLLVLLFVGVTYANYCGDTCSCWDNCFKTAPNGYQDEYARLYSLIQTLRGGRIAYSAAGTAFIMDATTSSTYFNYQRDLAALVAMTLPVEKCCNPFYLVRSYWWGASATHSHQCQCKCEAALTLQSLTFTNSQWSSNNLWLGTYLANYMSNYGLCTPGQKKMAIAFTNSYQTGSSFPGFDVRARVNVRSTGQYGASGYANPNAPMDLDLFRTWSLHQAVQQLNKCVMASCCNPYVAQGRKKRETDGTMEVSYVELENDKEVQTRVVDADQLAEEMAKKYAREEEESTTREPEKEEQTFVVRSG